jgi:hypothetical protein
VNAVRAWWRSQVADRAHGIQMVNAVRLTAHGEERESSGHYRRHRTRVLYRPALDNEKRWTQLAFARTIVGERCSRLAALTDIA